MSARQLAATAGTALRPLWHLFAFYPLLLLAAVGLGALVYGLLLHEYDAFHLLWNESPVVGFVNGVLIAFALGVVVMAAHLTDRRAAKGAGGTAPPPASPPASPPDWAYRATWAVLLALVALPAVGRGDPPLEGVVPSAAWRWWFPLGLAGAATAYFGLRAVVTGGLKSTPRVGRYVVFGLGLGYVGMVIAHSAVPSLYIPLVPASVSALMLFAFVTALFGAVTYLDLDRRWWLYPVLLVLVVLPFAFPRNQIENRLPNMTVGQSKEDYYRAPTRLADYGSLRRPAGTAQKPDAPPPELLAWNERMTDEFGSPQPLVLVTCSGGASASAIYTADVLFTLEVASPGFSKRVRVISGASGGMLGAAYFVSQLRPGGLIAIAQADPAARTYRDLLRRGVSPISPELAQAEAAYRSLMAGVREQFFRGLEADFLSPLVQKWVHKDMPTSPFGLISRLDSRFGHTTNDRGTALERAWAVHQDGALDVPFRELRTEELAGDLPSLVFSPMMVEDGRQLLVSNLDLDYMTETGKRPGEADGPEDYLSYMGVEFFKLFPRADKFKLSTAVRMNASFPLFSPAVALPTDPVRHVVDAGYYDNYGLVAATKWLLYPPNRAFLTGLGGPAVPKGPEVLLLRIRCFGDQQTPLMVPTAAELERYEWERHGRRDVSPTDYQKVADEWAKAPADRPAVRTESGLFTVTAPLTGLFSAWRANMAYRSDERLSAVLREYRNPAARADGVMVKVKVSDFPLFCRAEPSLNWVLSRRDIDAIHEDVRRDLARPGEWANFANGRGTSPDPAMPVPPAGGDEEKALAAFVEAVRNKDAATRPEALTPSQRTSLEAKYRLAWRVSQMAVPRK